MAVRQVLGAGATPLHRTVAAAWMASGTAAPGLGDGAPVLGDGGAGARGRGAGARGARLRFGAVEWRLRIGARARGKKGKQGSTVGSSPHPAVLMIYTAWPIHNPAVLSVYTAGSIPNPAVLSLCRPLQSASHVYFIQDKVEAYMSTSFKTKWRQIWQ